MRQPVALVWRAFPRWLPPAAWWLAVCLAFSAFGCAGAPGSATATSAISLSPAPPPSATPPPATVLALSPSPAVPATLGATTGPLLGLTRELALADREMQAAAASATLPETQGHAQAVINTLVGAWGRWYDVGRTDDPSDRRGVFPGERVPGPANDTPTDLTPIGWGLRAYDQVNLAGRPAIQTVMGDVKGWRDNPRARYDDIQRAITGPQPNPGRIGQLGGQAMRALAWARLIIV